MNHALTAQNAQFKIEPEWISIFEPRIRLPEESEVGLADAGGGFSNEERRRVLDDLCRL